MRIGLIAPPWVPVPPPAYGGTELVVDTLARALIRRGHEVALFAVGSSTCPVPTSYLYREPPTPMGSSLHEAAHVLAASEALADFHPDVIHDHTVLGPLLPTVDGSPRVLTHHGPFDAASRRVLAETAKRAAVVAISRSQAADAGAVPIAAVILHGLDLDAYPAGDGHSGRLLFIGRMCADKGADRAIRIARAAGRDLTIITKIREQEERDYYDQAVAPLLGPDIEVAVEPDLGVKLDALRDAAALVNPIGWPEPFGLVMAEALACGTPVLAFPSGAAPEIVEDGVTGFLGDSESELAACVERIATLDRSACRAAAERRFGMDRMAADYEDVYAAVAQAADPPPRRWQTRRVRASEVAAIRRSVHLQ
ncbi:MAG TPA: glycosyltransferase family 4 protein [Jatrophihabitans sp.]|uniref:glycosyltransferase family 4 protein n=1 Tax=Jatrophihabitans sp. TaxID=1932789 RepID=UPI002DF8FF36|nr:glycosyltransferase family 4 protein [Jatrophihabitans sp.]